MTADEQKNLTHRRTRALINSMENIRRKNKKTRRKKKRIRDS